MEYILLILIFLLLLFDRLNIFLYIIIASVLHESGHITACLLCGYIPKIKISVFGIKLSNYPNKTYKKLLIIIAGPLINLLAVIVCKMILNYKFVLNVYIFMAVNVITFTFNLLPLGFLDGGQIADIFVKKLKIRKLLNILSFILISILIVLFSDNVIYSFFILFIFITYYILNLKSLL